MKQKAAISQICIIVAIIITGSEIGFLWMGFWGSLLVGSIGLIGSMAAIHIASGNNQKHSKMKFVKKMTLMDMLVASAVAGLIAAIIVPVRKPHPMSPYRRTHRNILEIRAYAYGYYREKNKWPDETRWKEELKESAQDDEIEHWDSLFIDGWKNPIQYRIVEKDGVQTVLLYSFGKNKMDDNGTGDDIVRKIEPPTQEEIDNYKSNTEAALGG